MLYERGSYTVSGPTPAAGTDFLKSVARDLLHQHLAGCVMYRGSGMYSSKGRCYRGCRRLRIGGR